MRPLPILLMTLAIGALSPAALAQPARGADAARARVREGMRLYESGSLNEAIAKFEEADRLFRAPQNRLFIARARAKLGRLIAAKGEYTRIVRADYADSPESFRTAQSIAKEELAAVEKRIPRVQIEIVGARVEAVSVRLDGVSIPIAELGGKEVDPGAHTLEAEAPGGAKITRSLDLAEAAVERVDLVFVLNSDGSTTAPEASDPWLPAAVACFGAGGLGLVLGSITGVASAVKVGDLESRCVDGHCPATDAPEASTAGTLGDVSTAAFVVGAAALAAGGVLLFFRPASKPGAVSPPISAGPRGVSVRF
jgi:hypothetical protein